MRGVGHRPIVGSDVNPARVDHLTLADDSARLRRFLFRALQQGLYLVPDGRFYTSAVHTEKELTQTLEAMERIFSDPTL